MQRWWLIGISVGVAHAVAAESSSTAVPVVIASSTNIPIHSTYKAKQTASHAVSSHLPPNATTPRIEETRSYGSVTQIKVNNSNLPDYYLYPNNSTGNKSSANNNVAGSNVTTSSWKFSW